MNKTKALISAALLAAILQPVSAFSHSLYIQSGRYTVPKGKISPMFFCFGHHFPVDDGVRGKKLRAITVIAPDGTEKNIEIRNERTLHSYEVKYDQPGTYVLTAETNPGLFAMYIDQKGRSRHTFKPKHTWIDKAEKVQSSMRSSQWAKSYVVCDTPSENFPASVGLAFELVPATPIAELKEGDTLEFQAYLDGAPYTGEGIWDATYGGFSSEAEDMFVPRTKITGGKFAVPLDHGGRWFVRFFTKTEAAKENQEKFLTEKRTATVAFMVRNERKHPKPAEH